MKVSFFKKVLLCLLSLPLSLSLSCQPAACVHGTGISYLMDAYLGSLGACNCEKAPVFLSGASKCNVDPFVLDFEDDFLGSELDTSVWEIQPWGQGALDNMSILEHNSLDNITIKDGICYITAKKETVQRRAVNWKSDDELLADGKPNLRTYHYTSSNIWSKPRFFQGKYEIRCKSPAGNGFWPAFWTFGGTRWNEIDILDNYAGPKKHVSSTGHDYEGNGKSNGCSKIISGFDFTQWHTFTCIFDSYKIDFLIDDVLVRTIPHYLTIDGKPILCNDNIGADKYFQQKSYPLENMSIIVNLALIKETEDKGDFIPVDSTTPFPGALEIDYIRYWKRVKDTFNVFPNPASEKINIISNHTNISNIAIYNLNGKKLLETVYNSTDALVDLSSLQDGIFLLRINYDGGSQIKKVVKISGN